MILSILRSIKISFAFLLGIVCKENGCRLERWHRGGHYGIADDSYPVMWKNKDG